MLITGQWLSHDRWQAKNEVKLRRLESSARWPVGVKRQTKIQDPAKLRRLVADLIDKEQWVMLDADLKGDAYEGLLEKNAEDVKTGAGQYFTPRALIRAIVDVMLPAPMQAIFDPACGTGGFLLIAHEFIGKHHELDKDQKKYVRFDALRGMEIVDNAARLCAMKLLLHGIGRDDCPVKVGDSLNAKPSETYDIVMTDPPFGKKSGVTVISEEGEQSKESLVVVRDDFWASTSNKQLNFLQHVKSCLNIHGRAAIVVPDNVLFEGGAGETVRRKLLHECDVHTLLRLLTGTVSKREEGVTKCPQHARFAGVNAFTKSTTDWSLANHCGTSRNGMVFRVRRLFRHKRDHLPQKLILTKRRHDTLSAESLLEEMAHLKAQLRCGLDQAEAAGNPQAFLSFSREYRATLEAYFTITERMAEKAQSPGSLTPKGIEDLCHLLGIDRATDEELEEASRLLDEGLAECGDPSRLGPQGNNRH
jgi:hypothetical protein